MIAIASFCDAPDEPDFLSRSDPARSTTTMRPPTPDIAATVAARLQVRLDLQFEARLEPIEPAAEPGVAAVEAETIVGARSWACDTDEDVEGSEALEPEVEHEAATDERVVVVGVEIDQSSSAPSASSATTSR